MLSKLLLGAMEQTGAEQVDAVQPERGMPGGGARPAAFFRLAILGMSKNVGKTTVLNHLLETLPLPPEVLGLTSLGLDGEALDALTGLPKPRVAPAAGLLLATARRLLGRAGVEVEVLEQLPGRTALGPVVLGRVRAPCRVELAGPTLLSDLARAARRMQQYGAQLVLVDGAINRVGAAAPGVTDACVLCTGATVGASAEAVARRTVETLARLETPVASPDLAACFAALPEHARLAVLLPGGELHLAPPSAPPLAGVNTGAALPDSASGEHSGLTLPDAAAGWLVAQARAGAVAGLVRGALGNELARALLHVWPGGLPLPLVLADPTRILASAGLLRQLADRGLVLAVAQPVRVLALTLSPFAMEAAIPTEQLAQAIAACTPRHPPLLDVVGGLMVPARA